MSRLPVVVVIGRPNVGKSTLVNRILQRRAAVVDEQPGVTRDRREFAAEWQGNHFLLIDTGGWELNPDEELTMNIREQAEAALGGADVAVFVTDATAALVDDDQGVARMLLRSGVPFVFAANKVDGPRQEENLDQLWSLGSGGADADLGTTRAGHRRLPRCAGRQAAGVRRRHGPGAARWPVWPSSGGRTWASRRCSTSLQAPSGCWFRMCPGTTRDPINLVVELDGEPFEIIDTAGIKRRTRIKDDVEFYAVLRAREVLAEADVALLIVDGTKGATHQEQRLAEEIRDAGAGLVVLLNKWDVITRRRASPHRGFGGRSARLCLLGAGAADRGTTGSRLHRLPAAVRAVLENRRQRIPTSELNRLIRQWQEAHPPPVRKNKRPRIIYATQISTEPPSIVLFVRGGDVGDDYLRYLENRLREEYDFMGTPLFLTARRRHNRRELQP